MLSAAHAPAQLVELREAEAVRVLDDHQRRVRHVHADLDDRCGHQHVRLAAGEGAHYLVLLLGLHLAVDAGDFQVGQGGAEGLGVLLGGLYAVGALLIVLYARADDEDLPSLVRELLDEAV